MVKPTICLGENKVTAKLISAFVFATRIVQFLLYLTPKFQASSLLLYLYRPVCNRPVPKPHCCFFSTRWLISKLVPNNHTDVFYEDLLYEIRGAVGISPDCSLCVICFQRTKSKLCTLVGKHFSTQQYTEGLFHQTSENLELEVWPLTTYGALWR